MNTNTLLNKLGFSALNNMQQEAGKAIAERGKDVVILSPTGTGKTLAYLLPMVQRIDVEAQTLQMVVIVPGRELAVQSATVLKALGSGLRGYASYGGRMTMEEHRELKKLCPHVVFATPGRLGDHLAKGNLNADTVKWLVIDEFDKCLEMGFRDEMKTVLDWFVNVEQRVLLSATDADEIPRFVNLKKAIRVDFLEEASNNRLKIWQLNSDERDKLVVLGRLLRFLGEKSAIVFLNHRESVDRTAAFLVSEGFTVSSLHGGMEQKNREDALYKFSNGSATVLVSTDLASRGLDIPEVDTVVHYHLPETPAAYAHRVGRTARWKDEGNTVFIIGPGETIPDYAAFKAETLCLPEELPPPAQPRMVTLYIGKGKKDKLSKADVLGFLCKTVGLDKSDVGKIDVKERFSYVAVSRMTLKTVLHCTKHTKIKGIKTIVEQVK